MKKVEYEIIKLGKARENCPVSLGRKRAGIEIRPLRTRTKGIQLNEEMLLSAIKNADDYMKSKIKEALSGKEPKKIVNQEKEDDKPNPKPEVKEVKKEMFTEVPKNFLSKKKWAKETLGLEFENNITSAKLDKLIEESLGKK